MSRLETQSVRALYISYDGLLEPLGHSQVLQYVRRLARKHRMVLVTFEKSEDWADVGRRQRLESEVAAAGIEWHPLRYHRSPSVFATSYDLLVGFALCAHLVRRHRIEVVHARSYVPSVIALGLKKSFKTRFIFDMRGFWADERLDGGSWSADSRIYRTAKRFEREFLRNADVVVSLTHAAVGEMERFVYLQDQMPRFEVIPTCTDLDHFRLAPRPRERGTPLTIGYVGSVGTWYLFDSVLEAFLEMRRMRPETKFVVLNRRQHEYVRTRMAAVGVPSDLVELKSVAPERIPAEMARMDAGVFFIRPSFSKKASAPTRLGELLASGIPSLVNANVGDMDLLVSRERVGIVIPDIEAASLRLGLKQLLELLAEEGVRERCRAAAERHFSVERGAEAYDRLYKSLADVRAEPRVSANVAA